jgi:cytochrome P450
MVPGGVLIRFRRDPLGFLAREAERHGGIFHFVVPGQKYYVLNDPELIRRVLVAEGDGFMKGRALQRSKNVLGEGLVTSEEPLHRKQRKLMAPYFHAKWVEKYAEAMVRCTLAAAGRWEAGSVVDVHEEMMRLTLVIAAETLFGTDMEADAEVIGQAMNVMLSGFNRAVVPWGRILQKLPLPSTRKIERARAGLYATIDRVIVEARRAGGKRDDVLARLLQARDDESDQGMDDGQLRAECFTLLTAGHETTANLMTFAWYMLDQHPEVAAKVREEARGILGGRTPEVGESGKFVYLRQVLSEVMRLYPPVWVLGRMPTRPFQAGPYEIPAGSTVLMSQWVMHKHANYWEEPLRFDPERWVEGGKGPGHRYAYFPFGGGARNCIGDSFAWLEAIVVLATLVERVGFASCGRTKLVLQPTITLRPKGGLFMKVIRP